MSHLDGQTSKSAHDTSRHQLRPAKHCFIREKVANMHRSALWQMMPTNSGPPNMLNTLDDNNVSFLVCTAFEECFGMVVDQSKIKVKVSNWLGILELNREEVHK